MHVLLKLWVWTVGISTVGCLSLSMVIGGSLDMSSRQTCQFGEGGLAREAS